MTRSLTASRARPRRSGGARAIRESGRLKWTAAGMSPLLPVSPRGETSEASARRSARLAKLASRQNGFLHTLPLVLLRPPPAAGQVPRRVRRQEHEQPRHRRRVGPLSRVLVRLGGAVHLGV